MPTPMQRRMTTYGGVPQMPQYDENGNVIDDGTGVTDPTDPGAGPAVDPGYLNPQPQQESGPPIASSGGNANFSNSSDPKNLIPEDRALIANRGDAINTNATATENYQNQQAQKYRNQADNAYGDLNYAPGYKPDENNKIAADYGQFRTSPDQLDQRGLNGTEQASIIGDPRSNMAYLNPKLNEGITAGTIANERNETSKLQTGLNDAIDPNALRRSSDYTGQVSDALGGEESGISSALNKQEGDVGGAINTEDQRLQSAADRSKLGLDAQFAQGYRMTDRDVQDQQDMAARQVGNKSQADQDSIERAAAAEGNTSPLAIAAAKERLSRESGATAADAMTNARIKAREAQAGRNLDLENLRTSDERDIAGRQAQAATTIGQQRQAGAQTLGQQRVAGAATLGQQKTTAANQGEQLRMGGEQDIASRKTNAATVGGNAAIQTAYRTGNEELGTAEYNQQQGQAAEKAAEQQSSDRWNNISTNRQKAVTDQQNTAYNQGVGTTAATAAGTQTAADARRSDQSAYRGYVTGQQNTALNQADNAANRQSQNYATQTGAAGNAANTAVAKSGQPTTFDKITGAVIGAAGAAAKFFADGGVVTKPTLSLIGEHGPEAVVPLGNGVQVPLTTSDDSGGPSTPKPSLQDRVNPLTQPISTPYGSPARQDKPQAPEMAAVNAPGAAAPYTLPYAAQFESLGNSLGALGAKYKSSHGTSEPSVDTAYDDGGAYKNGGVVTKPTLALVGEAGPEAIVPLKPGKDAKILPSELLKGVKSRYQKPSGPAGPHGPVKGALPWKQLPAYR